MLIGRSRFAVKKVLRFVRLSHNFSDPFNLQNMQIIKTFDKTVDPSSKIYLETPMNVKIEPIDYEKHPEGDRLILNLYSHVKETSSAFTIKQTAKRVDVVGNNAQPDSDAVCIIQAPVNASFDIQASGNSSILIDKMHSEECNLKTTSGMVKLKDMKGKSIKVVSNEGPVVCEGTIFAEKVDIRTDSHGDVAFQHIRSSNLKVSTNGGDISTDSCYSDESHFTTVVGSLKLGNLHRNCVIEILERGDLSVTGFDGTIKAILKRGNVYIQASKLADKNSIFVHESGLVEVNLSNVKDDMTLIELIAKKLTVDEEILKLGKIIEDPQHQKFRFEDETERPDEHELYVECRNGNIELKLSSWKEMLIRKGIELDKS